MIKIQWITTTNKPENSLYANITYFAPEPAFKYFLDTKKESEYLMCPAFSDFLKNTFVIKAPFDFKISIDENKNVKTHNFDQIFFDENMFIKNSKSNLFLQIFPRYIFITNSKIPVKITVLPMVLQKNNVGFIPGEFYISKWVRPIEYAVEIYDIPSNIEFKRGDALFMVKFTPDKNESIFLEQSVLTEDIINLSNACLSVKKYLPNKNLKTVYKIAENYIELMKKRIF